MSCFMIIVLSSVDLAVVTIMHPLFVLQSINEVLETPYKCLFKATFNIGIVTLGGFSAVTLSVMNIERYLAIIYPIFHHVKVTKGKCLLGLIIGWTFILIIATVRYFSSSTAHVLIMAVVALICCTSLFTYVSIFYVGRKSLLKGDRTDNLNDRESSMNVLRGLKMARIYLLIVFFCFVTYLPSVVNFAVLSKRSTNKKTRIFLANASIWSDTLGLMNSTLNSVIFFWSNRELKKQGWKIVKNCFGQKR